MQIRLIDWGDSIGRVERKLGRSAAAGLEFTPVFAEISADMLRIEEAVFNSRGRRGGGSWRALSPSTVAKKGHDIPLFVTGSLRDSMTKAGAPFQILQIDNSGIEFGTTRPFAAVHQFGSAKAGVPRREFIKFTAKDRQHWMDMLIAHLVRPWNATK